jgi:RNA polymerase sigma-70 factor (ECF subfamily)
MASDGRDFAGFYDAEREPMARALLVIGGDAEAACDAVAEAFSRAYARWPRVSAMDSPMGWVYRVALNDLRRRMRRRARERLLLRRVHVEIVPPTDIDPELWAAVAALPPRQREAIVLRYVGDLTEREVATVLGISEGAASNALTAARRRLADQLTDREEASSP